MSAPQAQPLSGFEVRFVRAEHGFAVFNGRHRASGWFATPGAAANAARAMERKARAQARPCMCCQTAFLSEGPHHRLCNRCGHQNEGMI